MTQAKHTSIITPCILIWILISSWNIQLSLSEQQQYQQRTIRPQPSHQTRNAIENTHDTTTSIQKPSLSYGTVKPLCSMFQKKKSRSSLSSPNTHTIAHYRGGTLQSDGADKSDPKKAAVVVGMMSPKRKIFTSIALLTYPTIYLLAKLGLLRGPIDTNGEETLFLPYTNDLIIRDLASSIFCTGLAYLLTKFFSLAAKKGRMNTQDSRKCIHTFAAPLFMFVWPIFSNAKDARVFAVVPTSLNACRLLIAGSSSGSDEEELANAVSRTGDTKEALGGPFIYVLMTCIAVLVFWRDNLIGIVAVSIMAAGDGMADLIGRRYGKTNKWFFNSSKSIVGSTAFFLASTVCSFGLSLWLDYTGSLVLPSKLGTSLLLAVRITIISAICTAVELLPVGNDNITVPICAAILAYLLLY